MVNLTEKKNFYEDLKIQIATEDFTSEIDKKVEEYRTTLIKSKEDERRKDIDKINNYLDLLNVLLEEEMNEPQTIMEEENL